MACGIFIKKVINTLFVKGEKEVLFSRVEINLFNKTQKTLVFYNAKPCG